MKKNKSLAGGNNIKYKSCNSISKMLGLTTTLQAIHCLEAIVEPCVNSSMMITNKC